MNGWVIIFALLGTAVGFGTGWCWWFVSALLNLGEETTRAAHYGLYVGPLIGAILGGGIGWRRRGRQRHVGWLALLVVVLGFVLPNAAYSGLSRYVSMYGGDNLAWEEGGAFEVWLGYLIVLSLSQIIGLLLACQSRSTKPGIAAGIGAICLLALVGAAVVRSWDGIALLLRVYFSLR
jgi:hypothetical protein